MKTKTNILNKILLLLCVAVIIFCLIPIEVDAANTIYCKKCGTNHDLSKLGGIGAWVYEMEHAIYQESLFGDNKSSGFTAAVKFDITKSPFKEIWLNSKTIFDVIMPFGYIMAFVYFFMQLGQRVFMDNYNAEMFFSDIVKLSIGFLILINLWDIATYMMEFATFIYNKIANFSPGTNPVTCSYKEIKDMAWWKQFMYGFERMLPYFAISFCKIIIMVVGYVRIMNLSLYTAFSPIGASDIGVQGMHGRGYKYIKKILSFALQGAVMLATLVGYQLASNAIGQVSVVGTITLGFVAITVLFQSGNIAAEVVGA